MIRFGLFFMKKRRNILRGAWKKLKWLDEGGGSDREGGVGKKTTISFGLNVIVSKNERKSIIKLDAVSESNVPTIRGACGFCCISKSSKYVIFFQSYN